MVTALVSFILIAIGLALIVRYLWNQREKDKVKTAPMIIDWLESYGFENVLLHAVEEFLKTGKEDGQDFLELKRLVKLITDVPNGYSVTRGKIEVCLADVMKTYANRGLKINIWPSGLIDIAMGNLSYLAYGSDGKLLNGKVFSNPTAVKASIDTPEVVTVHLTFPDKTTIAGPVEVVKQALG